MAIIFETNDPSNLLSTFKKAIDDGHVRTWSYDADGDFTHNTDQWRNSAWLRPKLGLGQLILNTLRPKDKKISEEVYGIYHGRFIESMTIHCDRLFTTARSTAMPTTDDSV